jgi:hypothetical protein
MVCRYKLARSQGRAHYEEVVKQDQGLLTGFGLGLLSVENGLRVVLNKEIRSTRVNPWDVIEVKPKLWGWLRPLLEELRELRAYKARIEARELEALEAISAAVSVEDDVSSGVDLRGPSRECCPDLTGPSGGRPSRSGVQPPA